MARCFFCSKDVEPGRGIIFVTTEGKTIRFCSRKCRQAYRLGRNKKRLGWTKIKKPKKKS